MVDERVVPNVTNTFNLMKHIARYNAVLSICKGKSVLDLACGTGYGSLILSLSADVVVGFDISKKAVEFAKNNFTRNNIRFLHKDILEINSDDLIHKADVVVSFETIEHIDDLKKLESVFDDILDQNGVLVISVPINEEYINPYHKHRFTLETAKKLFLNHFVIKDIIFQEGIMFFNQPTERSKYVLIVFRKKGV